MKKILCSNGFKVVLVLLLTMAVFCGALLLATYTAEKSAFADNEYTFTQYIYSSPLPDLTDNDCWRFFFPNDNVFSPSYLKTRGFEYSDSVTLISNHWYALYYRIYIFGTPDYTIVLPDNTSVTKSYAYMLNLPVTYFDDVIFFRLSSDTSLYFSFRESNDGRNFFGISSFYLTDISLTPFASSFASYTNEQRVNKVFSEFGSFTKIRTLGVPYDNLASYSLSSVYNKGYNIGYSDGYDVGYDVGHNDGYNDGFSSGVNHSRGISYTFTESDYVPEFPGYPLFENVIDNYWSIWAITDDEAWLKSSVGFTDMFGYSYAEMKTKQVSFQWFLPTASVSEGYYSYGSRLYSSVYVTFDDNTECIVLSDSEFPITETYNIYIELFSTHTMITTSFFGSHVQNSQAVPNFYNGFGIDIYALSFSLNDPVATVYADGFNTGVTYADSRVSQSSASYVSGWNNGVDSAGNYTFKSLISSVIDVPVKTFVSLFNFDFLGINLLNFLLSLLTIGLIVAFIKLLI